MKPAKWIWQYINPYKWHFIMGLLLNACAVLLALSTAFFMGMIAKEVFQEGNIDALPRLLFMMVGATVLKHILRYIYLTTFESVSQRILLKLRNDIYRRVQEQSFRFFDTNKVGDVMSRMTGDLDSIRHMCAGVIYSVFENVLTFLVAVALIVSYSWELALALLCVAPFVARLAFLQAKNIKPYFARIREQFSKLNSVCQENISGNRIVKAFTREEYEIEKFQAENQAFYDANIDSSTVWLKYLPKQDFAAGFLSVLLVLIGGIFTITGRIELYELIIVNGYLWAVNNPMRMFGWLVNDIQRFVASLDKIYALMREKIDVKNPEKPYIPSGRVKGAVEFRNVTFSYDKFRKTPIALKELSFKIPAGGTVGIVGATGSGKTTVANLLCRFYDVLEGEVLVDGVDVRKYDLATLRHSIGTAMQDVFLFSDTIEGNLAYGVPETPTDDLIRAAKTADADGFIRQTTDGYDTIVGERGVGLSGGQRQRLSLARALATNPSILILDDTTSAVDMETEHEIQTALERDYPSITKFIIAHRISSVKPADLILVLEDGELIESGTHDELIAQGGHYAGLFNIQYGAFNEREAAKAFALEGGAFHGAQ